MSITAIETSYRGYLFRSRLEARWAVTWDAAGVKYEYEKEGFDLGEDGYYLPDFYLPDIPAWVEIKGLAPTPEEKQKCKRLAERGDLVFMIYGNIGDHKVIGWASLPDGEVLECPVSDYSFAGLVPDERVKRNRAAVLAGRAARFEYDHRQPRVRFDYEQEG